MMYIYMYMCMYICIYMCVYMYMQYVAICSAVVFVEVKLLSPSAEVAETLKTLKDILKRPSCKWLFFPNKALP